MCFADDHGLAFLAVLIKCSPNLEKIKLKINTFHMWCENGISSAILEQYSDVWFEHLNKLKIISFRNFKAEMEFVKFILARSPKLKKVSIYSAAKSDQELEMLKVLLQAPPVEIGVY
ncbi:hypothetical protein L1987_31455 [Smallanthus sonchifolius]|uniref:Uncharacterized protein n=1 Tax=Smallanthus sonchifolius TaxID=185202 RepID=A0ACB9I729_9ASTR|nr:hypothetical protein L1987_31455 [Smallanthus sonchifolius]